MSEACCGPQNVNQDLKDKKTGAPSGATVSSFKVSGMDCSDEVSAVQNALSLPMVKKVDANIMNETVTVYHDSSISKDEISRLIEKAGLKVVLKEKVSFLKENARGGR